MEVHPAVRDDLGDHRLRPHREDNLIRSDFSCATRQFEPQPARPDEMCSPLIRIDPALAGPGGAGRGIRIDSSKDPVADVAPAHRIEARIKPEPG